MAGFTHAEMAPGQILHDAGATRFRQALQSGAILRCANLWMAQAHSRGGGEVEIEIYCSLDRRTDNWAAEVYYFSIDRALVALREYEHTGNMPEGE